MKFNLVSRLYTAIGVLLVASQMLGCNSSATSPGPNESDVVAQLQSLGPEVVKTAGYSTEPMTIQLRDGNWVAEMMTYDNPLWDYRRTSSKEMPFEGIVGCKVARWITRPYATKELAEKGAKDRSIFFQALAVISETRNFPSEPEKIDAEIHVEFVAEAIYDTRAREWKLKGVRHGATFDYFAQQRELWAKRFLPAEQPIKKETPADKSK